MFVTSPTYGLHAQALPRDAAHYALRGFVRPAAPADWVIDAPSGQPFADYDATAVITIHADGRGELQHVLHIPHGGLPLLVRLARDELHLTSLWFQRWNARTQCKEPPVDLLRARATAPEKAKQPQ